MRRGAMRASCHADTSGGGQCMRGVTGPWGPPHLITLHLPQPHSRPAPQRMLSILSDLISKERAGEVIERSLVRATTRVGLGRRPPAQGASGGDGARSLHDAGRGSLLRPVAFPLI
jgi:hypothetical protein